MRKASTRERIVGPAGRRGTLAGPLGRSINGFFRDVVRLSLGHPGRALFFARTALHQHRAAACRRGWEERDLHVPPLLIVSVTRQCNLRCAGCFIQAQAASAGGHMAEEDLRRLLGEARDLGVSIVALAGGEPLTRPEILDVAGDYPEMLFGTSIMVTRANFALTTSRVFVRSLVDRGCLAAGRGFIHVSPEGALEPCPFVPFSDVNVRDVSLGEALGSDLMRKIRDSGEHLSEGEGGCALWRKREWVASLRSEQDGRGDRGLPGPPERLVA